MGRKENRKLKKLKGESFKKQAAAEITFSPFIDGDTRIIPIAAENTKVPVMNTPGSLSQEEFSGITHTLSDKELNRIIYQNAQEAVRMGLMPPKPEDDFGTVMWFAWNFITDEMREAFPAIAKEYLRHFRDEDGEGAQGRSSGGKEPEEFWDVPYPRMNEATWDDAYFFRILLMMLFSARHGSTYSRNFLLSLYKVYYKQEYNKLKRLKLLTYLDLLEFHDEDCYRQGLSSGHTTDGAKSYRQMVIEKRMHEPGWTNVFGDRNLSPVPTKRIKKALNADVLSPAADEIRSISDSPDEPPIQPTASRVLIMCELMGIEIEEECNEQYLQMNSVADSMTKLIYLNGPEYRRLRGEVVERMKGVLRAEYPEMFDPYLYQSNEDYLTLQVAESIYTDVFKKYDTNVRMPYDSRKFDLPQLMAELTITLEMCFPGLKMSFDEILILTMVQYLAECLCDVMRARDDELDAILRFNRRKASGEWTAEEESAPGNEKGLSHGLAGKALRSVEGLRVKEEPNEEQVPEENLDEAALREELGRLRELLAQKEAALAESEQKVIRQRVLYEKSHEREKELESMLEESGIEHAELIALREFAFGLRNEKPEEDLDEETREQLVESIRDKKVAVLGGTERWIKRMRRLLPSWSFIGVEDDNIGSITALEKANYIFIYTSALKHKQYYKAMDIIKSRGKMLFYLSSTNTDECLRQFRKDLCR